MTNPYASPLGSSDPKLNESLRTVSAGWLVSAALWGLALILVMPAFQICPLVIKILVILTSATFLTPVLLRAPRDFRFWLYFLLLAGIAALLIPFIAIPSTVEQYERMKRQRRSHSGKIALTAMLNPGSTLPPSSSSSMPSVVTSSTAVKTRTCFCRGSIYHTNSTPASKYSPSFRSIS